MKPTLLSLLLAGTGMLLVPFTKTDDLRGVAGAIPARSTHTPDVPTTCANPPGPYRPTSTQVISSPFTHGHPTAQDPTERTMSKSPEVTPFLWFDDDAEQAVAFYTSLFPDSKVLSQTRWGDDGPVPKGTLMTARFRLAGRDYIALNGGPHYRLNEAFSLFVDCDDQAMIDHYWQALTADGGEESQCGWLKDRYGLSWQIAPKRLVAMLTDPDPARAGRVGAAMMRMRKIDVATLQRAYDGQ